MIYSSGTHLEKIHSVLKDLDLVAEGAPNLGPLEGLVFLVHVVNHAAAHEASATEM